MTNENCVMSQSVLNIYTDYKACVFIDGTLISEIEEYTFLRIPLKKGTYELKIIPVDFSNFADTRIYIMPENNIEDLIKVYFADKISSLIKIKKQIKYLYSRLNKQNCLELYNCKTGEIFFTYPQSITYVGEFNAEGFAPIMEGGSLVVDEYDVEKPTGGCWGFVNWQGIICIPTIYNYFDECLFYNYCKFIVEKDGLHGMIDQQNHVLIKFLYNGLSYINSNLIFANNYLNKWGAIDEDENIIFDFIYDNYSQIWNSPLGKNTHFVLNINGDLKVEEFHDFVNVYITGGKSCIYDLSGKKISDTEYTEVVLMTDEDGYIHVTDKSHDKPYKFLLMDLADK